ncbi:uncharacterized protein LACBIDRAFT_302841 [Laccaria bicolor S238N-H82]|uniref:Condensin complex subunit 2 n=1 Tax=Laccaria bicolor (strain S238N-H82 / ATCC MYA-4686) TaxID=486041 RepID=B0DIF1_LACBS|nr:uncharacterized protein LACBIDRAFT_302841 [Laccaria bicolor S238N-H82]EDR05679.1 predicted protein [Laccaria bicolor S238N-H82]|eukprot:XP_001883783.1 predicted protein [Laccaria bicolor S238N-H82]
MAPARRARLPTDSDNESDPETEQETPRPQRSGIRKRLSEVYNPDNDASFVQDAAGARVPLRSVNINDDAAEKRRRRKSTKITVVENAMAGPSSEGIAANDAPEGSRAAKQKQQLNSVDPTSLLNLPREIMSSNFEEWMKMATDNKINAANSWNTALIDYFHDMSLLRNTDDNSINFQRASCTLDGCVKIWTSRVDSVGTETDPSQPKKKKKTQRPGATLAKDAEQLRNKKPDLEFSVDPLFKKTCADFDEGGAHGLLMNHLSLGLGGDGGMRVIFDASDSVFKVEEGDNMDEPEDEVNLSYLRKEFMPDLSVLEGKAISHSLADFSFAKDAFTFDDTTFFQDNPGNDDDDDDDDAGGNGDFQMDVDGGSGAPVEDFFSGADAIGGEDYGGGGDMGGEDFGGDQHSNGSVGPGGEGEGGQPGPFVPFDPRRLPNERDLVLAMTGADGESGALDYFDQNLLKNWAGPEHWKLRKVIRRPDAQGTAATKATKTRQKKEVAKIDFLTPPVKDLKEIGKELFAPVTGKGAGINLPGTGPGARKSKKKKEKKDEHRLPDDMHFSSRQLVTLFLKPKFFLKMRGRRAKLNENGDGEVDENFWAQAAAGQAAVDDDHDGDETGGAVPFNTQFFQDDYDDGPGFDDGFDGVGVQDTDAGEQDLLAATQGQTRRVRPETVNYAKRAKRVDVRKLKENIWKGLDIVIAKTKLDDDKEDDESMDVDETSGPQPTNPNESRQFSQVISGLQKSYPKDKMDEISTSFCFICLLHLANEQGLKLESDADKVPQDTIIPDDDEDEGMSSEAPEGDKKIGNIWDIKIYRDPYATQAC